MTTTRFHSASEDHPRLVCRLARHWCALSGGRRPAHVRTCASCRAYFNAIEELDTALHQDAPRPESALPANTSALEHQILRAVRTAAAEQRPAAARRPARTWIAGGLCAAAAAVAIVLFPRNDPGGTPRSRAAAVAPADDAAVIIRTVSSLSTELVGSVVPAAGELVAQNPLQQELGSVYTDMRSALDFLALNFLPASGPASSTPRI